MPDEAPTSAEAPMSTEAFEEFRAELEKMPYVRSLISVLNANAEPDSIPNLNASPNASPNTSPNPAPYPCPAPYRLPPNPNPSLNPNLDCNPNPNLYSKT